ncbi:PAS domain S-box protein [Zavarzinella formosa]|uniref:PAS domain S-box protein n=1 Tax=Zavarzinella formosa TaxID=360055 RepID=UPI0002E98729|nr:PAS domain S-box protein [Zavarzinella formosa]
MDKQPRLLLVEDSADDTELILLALRRGGLDPTWERVDTQSALKASMVAGAWDAVLADHTMPMFGSTAALAVVRAADPDMPFIVVSGTVGEEAAVAMMQAGANDYILKGSLIRLAPAVRREVREAQNRRARRAAERTAAHLAAIVESSVDAIVSETIDGQLTSWNRGAERLYGWTVAEAIGRHVSFLVPPDKLAERATIMDRVRAGELVGYLETVRLHKDGQRIDISLTISQIRDVDGRLIGFTKTGHDIRERKRTDAALRASEERFRGQSQVLQSILDNMSDGVVVADETGKFLLFNPAAEQILRLGSIDARPEEWQERYSLFLPPHGVLPFPFTDNPMVRALRGESCEAVEMIVNHDRIPEARWISVNAKPMRDATGDLRGGITVFRNISEQKRSEIAIRLSEERYRTLIAATSAIVWNSPASGAFDTEQPAWTAFTGQTLEQHREWGWLDAIHPDDREETARAWAAAVKDRCAFQVEHRLRRSDKEYRHMSARAVPILDPGGVVREWVGIHSDITNRKRAEMALVESQQRLSLATGSAGIGIWDWDVSSNEMVWDARMLALYGIREREFSGAYDAWQKGLLPDDRDRAEGEIAAALAGVKDFHTEFRVAWPGGELRHIEAHALVQREAGRPATRMTGVNWDITDRKRAEEDLRLRDRAIQAATQGLIITDSGLADNPIIYGSPGFERITGYTLEESLGRNLRFLQGADTAPAAVAHLHKAIREENPCTVELLNYRKDGTPFWNELSLSPVRNATGRLTHFVGVQTDVTARRSLEDQFRQAQKMDAFGQLAGGVAHDFNNLLTIINGYSDLLLQSLPKNDPSRPLIDEIYKAGERSAGLTRQLLAFSRQQILAPRVLNLNEVVTETDKMLRRLIGEDVRLTTTLDSNLWAVLADPGQVEQVLLNLSVNARDAMPKGGRLTIETRNIELDEMYVRSHVYVRAGPHVQLSVTDTGSGMSPEVQSRIFEPFFTTKGAGKGTGLGLATVFGIIKQSGGHVAVYSEAGIGTSFKVYLPRAEQSSDVLKAPSRILAPPRGTETVLIAEDEAGVRELARRILAGCGYKILEAADGEEAMRMAEGHHGTIHLLITDVVMPGAGGRVVAEQINRRHPEVRVLYISGYTDDAVIRHGVLREGVQFLQKPFTPLALALKVREILDS